MILYDLSDTIVAVSSPGGGLRSILRITGPQALPVCERVFETSLGSEIKNQKSTINNRALLAGSVQINSDVAVDAWLYLFFAPCSYTGEDLAEIHVCASRVIVEALVQDLLARGLRAAGPGEFTARAYLNGKLDLGQAAAGNEFISSSNRLQLEAAEKLLSGRLTKAADEIRAALLDVLSLIEAGLDFSGEDIEFIGAREAAERLAAIGQSLEELLAGSIRYETLLDLPAIGIAGAPNAGKSSLLNALLGWERSIVSPQPKTTRDVLSGVLMTDRFQCVLFDCAGLVVEPANPLDTLAQRAAIEALQSCSAVLFCVDAAKADLREDVAVHTLVRPKGTIHVATKTDLLSPTECLQRISELAEFFHAEFLPVSSKTSHGLADLLGAVERTTNGGHSPPYEQHAADSVSFLALTARHRQAVTEAREQIAQAMAEVTRGHEEVAVLMIRAACQALTQIEQQSLDEQVLDRIFSRFCIGK
ncbi:MAG: 50S ribosome-binding GTPase [Planctomycetes bacterium]|nr:50S ribosome-binding GTPase [Planctomycetota bacterium]